MRNIAKCKLCSDIIESFHPTDMVVCKCGEIALDGGVNMNCFAKTDLHNIVRIDDEGNEIEVTVIDKNSNNTPTDDISRGLSPLEVTRRAIKDMTEYYQSLPPQALQGYVTGYDLLSVLLLVESLSKAD